MASDGQPFPHQRDAFDRLWRSALSGDPPSSCLITGPSGSGKTWLATAVAETLSPAAGAGGPVILVQGQQTLQTTPLACWRLAVHGRRSRFARPGAYHDIAQEAMQAASKVTLGLSEVVNVALGAGKRFRAAPATLSDEQFAVLYELAVLAGDDGDFCIVADDLQWWDEQSISVTRALFLPAFAETFPFLARTRVIGTLRADTERSAAVDRLLGDLRPATVRLDLPDLQATDFVARSFGVAGLDPAMLAALYAATGGHLQLLRELGGHLGSRWALSANA